jgi:hypothetical protein
MTWDPSVFFQAFQGAGMLASAVYQPAGAATPFAVGFRRPEVLVLGNEHQSAEFEIEYETAAVPRLRKGDPIQVTDEQGTTAQYVARAHATTLGNGFFSRCELEKA